MNCLSLSIFAKDIPVLTIVSHKHHDDITAQVFPQLNLNFNKQFTRKHRVQDAIYDYVRQQLDSRMLRQFNLGMHQSLLLTSTLK